MQIHIQGKPLAVLLLTSVHFFFVEPIYAIQEGPVITWKSTSCTATPITSGPTQGRSSVVIFPNGREITVVGHQHGSRQILAQSDTILSGQLAKMSDLEFDQYLRLILNQNKNESSNIEPVYELILKRINSDTSSVQSLKPNSVNITKKSGTVLSHAIEDYSFLVKTFSSIQYSMKPIEFIGHESITDETPLIFTKTLKSISVLEKEFRKRKKQGHLSMTDKEFKDTILSATNASLFYYYEKKDMQSEIPILGMESKEIIEEQNINPINEPLLIALGADQLLNFLITGESKAQVSSKISNLDHVSKKFYIELAFLWLDVVTMKISTIDGLKLRIQNLPKVQFNYTNEENNLFRALEKHIINNNKRENATAINLANQHQSGIHFVGINHLNGIVDNLEHICSQEEIDKFL